MEIEASFHQERLWFIDKFEAGTLYPAAPTYHNIPLILQLTCLEGEKIDKAILEQGIRQVIQRHEALRTVIVTRESRPVQYIRPGSDFTLEEGSLPGSTQAENPALAQAVAYAQQPFSLAEGALLRGKLFYLQAGRYWLVLGIHHIIGDYHSLELISRELLTIYHCLIRGTVPDLAQPTAHYADFSRWQRGFSEDVQERLLFYWKRKLKGGLQPLELPTDRPREAVHLYGAAWQGFDLPGVPVDRQPDRGCMLFLVALKILLHRYSGQDDILVGTSLENRDQPEMTGIVGPLVNLVPLRSLFRQTMTARELLEQVGQTVDEAREYGAIPFDQLVLELKPDVDMSRTALFDVLFQYREKTSLAGILEGIKVDMIETNLGWGKYDLSLLIQVGDRHDPPQGILVFNSRYYNQVAISRLIGHYRAIAGLLAVNPDIEIGRLPFLGEAERHCLLEEWNRTEAAYPDQETIAGLFTRQAVKEPDRVALVLGDACLSYGELNGRADKLARSLRQAYGVGADTIVAIQMGHCFEAVTGILGILLAGGAYLPIDPDYPQERIDFMLADSGAKVCLTTDSLDLSDYAEPGKGERQFAPTDLAYVIYTSGTTGKPKGSLVEHRHVVRLMFNDRFPFDFDPQDTWCLFHSLCFDFSVWEMYGALLYGGRLVIIPRLTAKNPAAFLEILRSRRVTVLNQTPPSFYNLAKEEVKWAGSDRLALRYVIFGGDALQPARLKEWHERYPAVRLINMYGITETTVHVTFKEVTGPDIRQDISNIGMPIPTLTTYILDARQELLPIGVPGELWVGGKGVCRGYLNRVMLTGERFMTNPHRPGEIIYRSGDRVKRLENGEMEYLGRVDHQVKIRGFRIELGEIEHRLLEIPGIKAGVVIDRQEEGRDGGRYLCAYFVSEQDISATEIRHRLAEKLPGYMVPAHFVCLPFIPLTANGKTDRGALPDPEIEAGDEYVPPDSDSERHLAATWAEVLHLDPQVIGRKTNFFEIGGNSLKIYHLAEKLKEVFAREIPVVVLFEYPTIQDQALYLAGTAGDRAGEKAGEKAPAGREDAGCDRITRGREQIQGRRERLSKPGK